MRQYQGQVGCGCSPITACGEPEFGLCKAVISCLQDIELPLFSAEVHQGSALYVTLQSCVGDIGLLPGGCV